MKLQIGHGGRSGLPSCASEWSAWITGGPVLAAMFATGAVLLPFFSFMTFLIAIPTGLKFFNWIGTMWKGQVSFQTPMLFAAGFLVTFLFGGLTGVILAAPPLDFHVSDTYFVVAHFHYVVFCTIVFATYPGIYFWFPR